MIHYENQDGGVGGGSVVTNQYMGLEPPIKVQLDYDNNVQKSTELFLYLKRKCVEL